jgi:hypothetical protein
MRPPLARKTRISPSVEALEDRRLLSSAGPPSGWDDPSFVMPDHADLAPSARGSMLGSGDVAGSRAPGSAEADGPTPGISAIPDDRPDSAPVEQHRPSASPAPAPQGGDQSPTYPDGRGPADGQDWTASVTVASTAWASPAPSTPTGYAESIQPDDSVAARDPEGDPPTVGATFVPPPEAPARAAFSPATWAPTARLVVSFVTPAHVETDPSAHPEDTEPPTADNSAVAVVGMLPVEPNVAPGNSPRGSSTTGPAKGPGSASVPGRPALDVVPTKGVAEARSPEEAPPTLIEEAEGSEGRAVGAGDLAQTRIVEAIDRPDPQLADMIMSLLPVDRSALDGIADRFLDPLDGLSSVTSLNGPMGLLAASLTLTVTVLAAEMSLRMRRAREGDDDESLGGFPGLPGLARGSIS